MEQDTMASASSSHPTSEENVRPSPCNQSTQTEAPTQTMASSQRQWRQFNDLTVELKGLIISRLTRPTDLRTACLVSKQFHELAVQSLYPDISLDIGSPNDHRLSAFLSPKNIGLKYIRRIRLYVASVRDKCNQEQQAQLMCKMIVELLPEHILEEFSWCEWTPFSPDNLVLLYKKQKNLKWLEVMDLDHDLLPVLKKNEALTKSMFASARKLAIYPEDTRTLNLAGFYLENMKDKLEDLIIHSMFPEPSERRRDRSPPPTPGESQQQLNDSATAPGLLTSTIFRSMLPLDKCQPLPHLTAVSLHKVNLRFCADTWCKFINFHQVKELKVYSCTGTDSFLGQLSKAAHLPKNLQVLEVQHKDNSENEALLALEGFLCLTSGIQDLLIDLDNVKEIVDAAGITRHQNTLEYLNVHCSQNTSTSRLSGSDEIEELVWDSEDFLKICKACSHLRQLSCAWPSVSLIRRGGLEWTLFKSSCRLLRSLVTLQITTFPTNKPSTQLLPRSIYETLLQSQAQDLFQYFNSTTEIIEDNDDDAPPTAETRLPKGKLRLIAFGVNEKAYEREESDAQMLYLRSTCQNAMGKEEFYAARVSWCLARKIEGCSDILDVVLTDRKVRPPCREGVRNEMGWNTGDDVDEFEDV